MSAEPLVSVGIVTWNSAAHLAECLAGLTQQTYPRLEVIVVDNGSIDDSLSLVTAHCPSPLIIRGTTNRGFAGGHNEAIRASAGVYYMALNPDVIMSPGYTAALVKALEALPQYGSAGGKLLLKPKDGEQVCIDSTGLFIDRRRRQYLRGHGEVDQGHYEQAGEVFGLDGAAPLYRRAMLDDVQQNGQFFDETFFAYKEDVDLAWRARLLGWRAWYTPDACAFHIRAFRPGKRAAVGNHARRLSVRNRYLLMLKNDMTQLYRRDCVQILFYDVQILSYLLLREPSSLRAFLELPRLWPEMRLKRCELMQRTRVTPAQMMEWFR